jgi:hypothetical protein
VTKVKKPKAPKAPKPSKPQKGGKGSNSIEVKVKLPVTKVSIMSVLLAGLLTLMGYAGYLGVNSIWKFTHPQFNVSLDALKSIGYIASKASMPTFPKPAFNNPGDPDTTEQENYMIQTILLLHDLHHLDHHSDPQWLPERDHEMIWMNKNVRFHKVLTVM